MHRMFRTALLAVLALALVAQTAQADTVLEGATDGGALIKIQVPDAWNGSLVIYNHGFALGAIVPSTPDLGPLAGLMLSEGYAVAAIITKSSLAAVRLSNRLLKHGINALPIVYPAVEEKAARLRFFLTSEHSTEQVNQAVATTAEQWAQLQQEA